MSWIADLDVEASQDLIADWHPYARGLIEMVQSGAMLPPETLVHAEIKEEITCRCGYHRRALTHLCLDCQEFDGCRKAFRSDMAAFRGLPPEVLEFVLVPENPVLREKKEALLALPRQVAPCLGSHKESGGDGSARPPRDTLLRRSTFAIVDDVNYQFAARLQGFEQTAPRAELEAIVAALEAVHEGLHYSGDCRSVINEAKRRVRCFQAEAPIWPPHPLQEHGDLWARFDELEKGRLDYFMFSWVKGHQDDEKHSG